MEQMSSKSLAKMQEQHTDGITIEQLKKRPVPHGKLVGCSYYAYTTAMQFNSDTMVNISVSLVNGVQHISYKKKEAFCSASALLCRPNQDVLAMLGELAGQENMAAWSELKYHEQFQRTDWSSGASLTLFFDDRETGGGAETKVMIDVNAAYQCGGGAVIKRFYSILEDAVKDAQVLKEVKGARPNFGMMSMLYIPDEPPAPAAPSEPPAGAWQCKNCGFTANTGKFCTECGSRYE